MSIALAIDYGDHMIRRAFLAAILAAASLSSAAWADDTSPAAILKSLNFRHGHIDLMGGIAALSLNDRYAYLDRKDAETFLTKIWGNRRGPVRIPKGC
jgi:hypothetical protein